MPGQLLQGPGQRGGGGVVPGGQQCHQLITQLGVAHLSAVVVGGAHQHGQHVGPVSQVRVGATIGDLGVQQRVRLIEAPADVPPRTALLKFRTVEGQRRPRSQAQHPRHDLAQCGQPGRIGGADDGAQNHLQGDLGHFRADWKLGTHRPPGDIGGGEFAHHRRLARNGLSRERRHHQAAPIAVDVTVDDEHRTLAEDLSQHRRIRLAGMKYRRITGEDGLDVSGVGQINQRPHRRDPHGEHIPVVALVGGHQSGPVAQQQCCLNHAGQRWTRRQLELG